MPQVCIQPQGLKRLLRLRTSCTLNNYEYLLTLDIEFQFIESIQIKDFNEEKNIESFSFYNFYDAYETKLKRRVWFISYFLY